MVAALRIKVKLISIIIFLPSVIGLLYVISTEKWIRLRPSDDPSVIKGLPKFDTLAKFTITEYMTENITQPLPCKQPAFLLLAINSHAAHFYKRKGIRNSWGNGQKFNVQHQNNFTWRTVFVVGRSHVDVINAELDQEAEQYGDLILLNFRENYEMLTEKTVAGMYWANKNCRPAFFYKGDDDIWLNSLRLFDYVTEINKGSSESIHKFWIGRLNDGNPVRKKNNRYYISPSEYKWELYPPFCSGCSYIMSGIVLEQMVQSIPYVKKIPSLDDVYVGLLAYRIGVKPINNRKFCCYWTDTNREFSSDELDSIFVRHGIYSPEQQATLTEQAYEAYFKNKV